MNIIGLELPADLETDLASGGRELSHEEISRFRELLNHVESPLPKLFDHESIVRENQLWSSESAKQYLGLPCNTVVPGDIDPRRTLIIGQAEPDSPLALDYRTEVPRVIYFGDIDYESYWIEVSPDYKSLVQMLQKETIINMSIGKHGSPQIVGIEWGKIEVDGLGTLRDAKLYPGGGREWDWRETNTHHVPGIQPTDVQELIAKQCEVIVLTRGMQLVLKTCPETLEQLQNLSIETFVQETNAAVVTYNNLVSEGKSVGGLFHSTC